jgi:hypothetical protein
MIKFYYGPEENPQTETYRIIPPPQISIAQNNIYANDVIIGYTYSVTLNGYASNYIADYSDPDNIGTLNGAGTGSTTPDINANGSSIRQVLYAIKLIKKLLSRNGSNLKITDINNNNLLVAKAGTLKSLAFNENDNSWTKYAQYTAELEFNELILINEPITCTSGQIAASSITTNLVDLNKYKIKEFNDTWSFDVQDEALNFVLNSDNNQNLNVQNTIIGLSYNISAKGNNYFDDSGNLLPGWLQAKNFVQKRLYNQVQGLSSTLNLTGSTCEPILNLTTIHSLGNSGLIKNVSQNYAIYDETIQCSASESEGTFNLNYTAKLKTNNSGSFSSNSTLHTFSKEISLTNEGGKKNTRISVNGTITGLCEGGLVKSSGNFSLPDQGYLLIGPSYKSKFNNAANLLTSIIDDDDLTSSFKTALNINSNSLSVPSGSLTSCDSTIKPASFNLTKNYMEGTITYSAEYTTDRACAIDGDKTVSKSTIDVSLPTPIIAEFPIPGGNFLLQDINTVSSRKVNITVEGKSTKECCTNNGLGINVLLTNIVTGDINSFLPAGVTIPEPETSLLTQKELNYNPIDGSYTITVAYVCSEGCELL